MLILAQGDLEGYTWGEESQTPDIWRQAYIKYDFDGNQIMKSLEVDVDTYLASGNGEFSLVWAEADLFYEQYKSGKLKSSMTEEEYINFTDKLDAINKRLGVIYAKREYITP